MKGVVKFTLNSTSSPVTGPLPSVVWFGLGLIPPGCTELAALKLADNPPGVKLRPPLALSRSSSATSEESWRASAHSESEFSDSGTPQADGAQQGKRSLFHGMGPLRTKSGHSSTPGEGEIDPKWLRQRGRCESFRAAELIETVFLMAD
jgi:hypothetical protein